MKIKVLFYGNQNLIFRMFYLKWILQKSRRTLIIRKMWLAGRDNTFVIVKRKLLEMETFNEEELY